MQNVALAEQVMMTREAFRAPTLSGYQTGSSQPTKTDSLFPHIPRGQSVLDDDTPPCWRPYS